MPQYDFLSDNHPVFEANRPTWESNERRYRGGIEVLDELPPFEWERDPSGQITDHYRQRKERAVYLNFAGRMAQSFVGALQREAPEINVDLSLGALGEVEIGRSGGQPTRAEQVWHSIDAPVGGAQFMAWWLDVAAWTMVTGHRWILREAPHWPTWAAKNYPEGGPNGEAPARPTRADELKGFRPYLVHHSPLSVPDWHFDEDGTLQYMRLATEARAFTKKGGVVKAETQPVKLLFVRPGWSAFGNELAGGGWFKFDANNEPLRGPDGEWVKGSFGEGEREIPAVVAYYQRDDVQGMRSGQSLQAGTAQWVRRPNISRPGLTEIGALGVAHMSLDSAGDNDALEAGSRRIYAVGMAPGQHSEVVKQLKQNSRFIGIPAAPGSTTKLHDTGSVSASEAISQRQDRKVKQAMLIAAEEAAWAPDSSAESKNAGFRDVKSPRLALFAEELESAMTSAIRLLEKGFGADRPTGFARWPRDFDLAPLVADIMEAIGVLRDAEAGSPTLKVHLIMAHFQSKGLLAALSEEEIETIEEELRESLESAAADAERAGDLQRTLLNRPPLTVEPGAPDSAPASAPGGDAAPSPAPPDPTALPSN